MVVPILLSLVGVAAAPPVLPGTLHQVSLADAAGAVLVVRPGDLLQLDYVFPIVPGVMPVSLAVELRGTCLRGVTVVRVPGVLVGAGTLAAFVLATGVGEAEVKVTPTGVKQPRPVVLKVVVKPGR